MWTLWLAGDDACEEDALGSAAGACSKGEAGCEKNSAGICIMSLCKLLQLPIRLFP